MRKDLPMRKGLMGFGDVEEEGDIQPIKKKDKKSIVDLMMSKLRGPTV
jgi:hypothetical protein